MTLKVVLLGSNGQLGSDVVRVASSAPDIDLVPLTSKDIDVTDHGRTADTIESLRPDAIINTAAFHKVETCETEPLAAFAVNTHAVHNLAQTCAKIDAHLVHISTDYVFGGGADKQLIEDTPVAPLNVYGVSKAAGEMLIRYSCENHAIVRGSGLFGVSGASGKGGNFVETMLRIGHEKGAVTVVDDIRFSPTYTSDMARVLLDIARRKAVGTFHATNAGECSWFEFAAEIFHAAGMDVAMSRISAAQQNAPVQRPLYSALRDTKLHSVGISLMRSWQEAVSAYLAQRISSEQTHPVTAGA